jgi:hypothetical protein
MDSTNGRCNLVFQDDAVVGDASILVLDQVQANSSSTTVQNGYGATLIIF